ncbi:hypercellular protein-like protein HypA [Delitschia confertaspora ATCC 74209]|uniref:Hypercellular protein-like protein HypA n=1 Tax=Delitschia confertaspora ATCC 74209 TaxID=1513339 RepID=A0A9P4MV66_9PLEO|nr:hypercellular protein-like protein HypA [Delitschia confertaspora ATCC 74209]
MAIDPLSPIAPARIRALLLPVGRIKRSRFIAFVELLQSECIVRLGDISPDPRPDRNMFSPLAFPNGSLLYELSTSLPTSSQSSLSPFEQFREPLLVIGIGDTAEYAWLDSESRAENGSSLECDKSSENAEESKREINDALEDLREQFSKVYLHSLLMFNYSSPSRPHWLPKETITVPPENQLKTTTMKTVMCDITRVLLAEMTTLARSIQALPTVKSPVSHQTGSSEERANWANSESINAQFSRRNSQIHHDLRPDSSSSAALKEINRMSMPVHLPSTAAGPIGLDGPRDSSPSAPGTRTPPTTFDEIPGINTINSSNRTNASTSKSSPRDSSADRVAIHGFGSGGVGERARNKGKGRVGIVIGTLYLCAGQWPDALRELTEGATKARTLSDHLWHAKALENILVCLLLFAWAGMDFQIPQICYPISDKSGGTKSPEHTPSNSVADITAPIPARFTHHEAALENLNSLIPDLVNMILNIYNRASNFAGENLPPLAHSECVIRFSKLLSAMNLSAGYLDDDALQHLVLGTPLRQKPRMSVPRLSVNPTRNDIAALLFRALPLQPEAAGISATDRVMVLAGIASVLSALGLHRKKAIVMKEFVTSLIPGLVQARKIGAAEMGVHPAAGLAALNMASGGGASGAGALNIGEGEAENGIDHFLELLGRIYGVPDLREAKSLSMNGTSCAVEEDTDRNAGTVQDIFKFSSMRSFGNHNLKLDVLRMCINFCEALPDFNGVLHFTALLLRIAGPGTAPKSNSTDVIVSLAREEQIRLANNISRTVSAARKLGLQNIETDYWDDFLVRGLFLLDEPLPLRLTQHRPSELSTVSAAKSGPFIHNPFLKKAPDMAPAEKILVAKEKYKFVIALQNPYEFEVEIESLKIAGEGLEFIAQEESFLLGPYRTQKFPIFGVARSSGTLEITGCLVKVKGCRERFFPIFSDPWKPEKDFKMKSIGLRACLGLPSSRPPSTVAARPDSSELVGLAAPNPVSLTLTVIPEQPVAVIEDISLAQSAIMVLEGERKAFSITLHNTSQSATVDFVHISFQDSATSAIQTAASNKDLPAAELHELEIQLAEFPSLRWLKKEDDTIIIKPGQKRTFEVEVVGRARLTDAVIQFDYASVGKRHSEIEDRFFTRQVSIPISITVNASVQVQRTDIVPLTGDFAWSNEQTASPAASTASETGPVTSASILVDKRDAHFQTFFNDANLKGFGNEYCMLLLDLRNSWPNPLSVDLQVRAVQTPSSNSLDPWAKAYTVTAVIQPGHSNRLVLILPKIYLNNPYTPIPSLNPAHQRQFVVSTSKISPETEQASREAFWYREELLKRIRGTWREEGNGRQGDIVELRNIRFTPRMVEAVELDDIWIETEVVADQPESGDGVRRLGKSTFEIGVDEFVTLKTRVHNRSQDAILPILRLQPHLANLPHNVALDLDKRFSWSGVLQRKLPMIRPGEMVESELGVVALCSGIFEIGATVEEIELGKRSGTEGARPRSGTDIIVQAGILGDTELRVWHLKEGCTVVARRRQ